jgi:PAS domain S-box-containing protein
MDIGEHGADLGRMAVRVLAGEQPDRIEPVTTATRLAFDWRELQRFGIRESALPVGATVLYRSPANWTLHPGWVAATACLLVAQTVLIGVMLAQRRRRASLQRTLAARLGFETISSELSAALGTVPVARMEMAVRGAVGMIRRHMNVDRVSVFELSPDGKAVRTVSDSIPGSPEGPDSYLLLADLPSVVVPLAALRPFIMENVDDLPQEAIRERAVMHGAGIRSMLVIPLEVGGHALGTLACVSHTREMKWPAERLEQLRTLGQLLANVIQRRQTDAAVSESDRLKGAILSSIAAQIAVLDRQGVIIAVNDAWTAFGQANGVRGEASVSPGASYLEVCERAASEGSPGAAEVLAGIKAVCEGSRAWFDCEYACDSPETARWFAMKAVPLRRPEGGAVVTHRDISSEKWQEIALCESEERFRLLADALPIQIWMSGLDKGCTYFNRKWLEFAGRSVESELGRGWVERVHAEDASGVVTDYSKAFDERQAFSLVYRLRRHDGVYRWILDQGTPRYDTSGAFHGFVGGCVDITDRIDAERQLRDLSGRLISAQEDERRRIARELHDDLQQRLALLAIELDGLARPGLGAEEIAARARDLWRQTSEISTELHRLSHRLHPSKLEALGLLATLQSYCREVSQRGLRVTFTHEDMPVSVAADVSLSVFRIVQESLQNVLKHSGATDASIAMSCTNGLLRLVVADSGCGFDVDEALRRGGIGLVGMRERLHLIGGAMKIASVPGGGTSIEFQVPLARDEADVVRPAP